MAWDDAPPKPSEIEAIHSAQAWDDTPPSPQELAVAAGDTRTTGQKLLNVLNSNMYPKADTTPPKTAEQEAAQMDQYKKELPSGLASSALMLAPIPGSALGRIAMATAGGGGVGALRPADTTEDRLKNAGMGALIGGTMGSAAEGASALLGKASDYFTGTAESRAFKAAGPYQRNVLQNADDIQKIGRESLDSGVIGNRPVGYDTLAERAGDAASSKGKDIESIVDELANSGKAPNMSRAQLADAVRESLKQSPGVPGGAAKNSSVDSLLQEFTGSGADELPLKAGRGLKSAVKDAIKWDRLPGADIPIDEQVNRSLYSQLAKGENNIADQMASSGEIPNGEAFKKTKEAYGALKEFENIAAKRGNKEFANQFLGLNDRNAGNAGAITGAIVGHATGVPGAAKVAAMVGGAGGATASKLARTYGNQIIAKQSDNMASILAALSQGNQVAPAALPAYANALLDESSGSGKMGAVQRRIGGK